jgi:hypothetical protein
VKCGVCQTPLNDRCFTIVLNSYHGDRTANLCVWCLDGIVGRANRHRLEAALLKVGWEQLPLLLDSSA